MTEQRRFYRSRSDKVIAGVCGGIGAYFGVDPVLIRIIAVVLLFAGFGAAGIAYIVLAIVVPEEPESPPGASAATGASAGVRMEETMESPTGTNPEPPPAPEASTLTQPPVPPEPPTYAAPAAPPPPEEPKRGGGGGATAGIILILIGAALLAAQFVPGVSIWALWPLFIIVPGVVQCFTPGNEGWSAHRFFDGLVTVAIGLVFLGNTTGVVSWSVWWELLRLWPVLLISAGLGILGRAIHQGWVRVLGPALVLVTIAYAVAASFTGAPVSVSGGTGGEPFSLDAPVGVARQGEFSLDSGVGEITMEGTGENRITVEGTSPFGEPSLTVGRSGTDVDATFKLTDQDSFTMYPGSPSARVDAKLPERVTWDVTIDSGVSSLDADLSDLRVARIELRTGVSSNTVRLGEPPSDVEEARAVVRTGVSSVRLLVPEDAEVRVESDSGLTGHDISSELESMGGRTWETPGYSAAQSAGDPVWLITVTSGVGSFALDTY